MTYRNNPVDSRKTVLLYKRFQFRTVKAIIRKCLVFSRNDGSDFIQVVDSIFCKKATCTAILIDILRQLLELCPHDKIVGHRHFTGTRFYHQTKQSVQFVNAQNGLQVVFLRHNFMYRPPKLFLRSIKRIWFFPEDNVRCRTCVLIKQVRIVRKCYTWLFMRLGRGLV